MSKVALNNLRARFGAAHEDSADTYEEPGKRNGAGAAHSGATARENQGQSLTVVIVYNDIHAILRAVETLERMDCKIRSRVQHRLLPVPVTQLNDPSRFDRLLSDANSADMIVVSFNGPADFPANLKKWVENCLAHRRAGESAIVALLSSNERLDAPDSPRYQFLKNIAWASGLEFFAPKTFA
jgi:hypothetical protein